MRNSMNRRTFVLGTGAVALAASHKVPAATSSGEAWERAADIARNVRAPKFPDRVFDIVKYGAVADGKTLNTAMIAKAIDACASAGGGRVLVPAGQISHRRDSSQEQRRIACGPRRDAALRYEPGQLSARVHAVGRHGAA